MRQIIFVHPTTSSDVRSISRSHPRREMAARSGGVAQLDQSIKWDVPLLVEQGHPADL